MQKRFRYVKNNEGASKFNLLLVSKVAFMSSSNTFPGRVVRTLRSMLKPEWLFRQQRKQQIASRYVRLSERSSRGIVSSTVDGGGLGDGRDFGLFMGRVGFAAGSDGRQIAWKDVTRHAVKDAEFVECQR